MSISSSTLHCQNNKNAEVGLRPLVPNLIWPLFWPWMTEKPMCRRNQYIRLLLLLLLFLLLFHVCPLLRIEALLGSRCPPMPPPPPPPPTEEGVNWRGGYCALLPLPQLLVYHHFYKYLLSPFGPLASKSKSAIASR